MESFVPLLFYLACITSGDTFDVPLVWVYNNDKLYAYIVRGESHGQYIFN